MIYIHLIHLYDSSKVLGIPYFLAPFYSIILLAATTTYIKMDSNFQLGLRGCINGQNPVNQNPLSFRCLRAIDYAVLIFFTVFMLSGLALKNFEIHKIFYVKDSYLINKIRHTLDRINYKCSYYLYYCQIITTYLRWYFMDPTLTFENEVYDSVLINALLKFFCLIESITWLPAILKRKLFNNGKNKNTFLDRKNIVSMNIYTVSFYLYFTIF